MMNFAAEHATMSKKHWGRPTAAPSLTLPLRQEVRPHVR
jgi:hypothetical protein